MFRKLDSTLAKRRDLTYIGYFLIVSAIMLGLSNKGQVFNIIAFCLYIISGLFLYRYARLFYIFMWGSFMAIINTYLLLPRMFLFVPRMLIKVFKKDPSPSTEATRTKGPPQIQQQTRPSYKFTIFTIPGFRSIYIDLGAEKLIVAGFYVICIGLSLGTSLGFSRVWAWCIAFILFGFILWSLGFVWPMLREKQTFLNVLHRIDIDELNDLAFGLNPTGLGLFFAFPLLLTLDIFYLCTSLRGSIILGLLLVSGGLMYGFSFSSSSYDSWRAGISIFLIGCFIIVLGLTLTLLLRKSRLQHNRSQTGQSGAGR